MTYDELLRNVIELAESADEIFDELQIRESAWGSDFEIDNLRGNLGHAKIKAERILRSRETYKLDALKGEVMTR